MTTLRFQMGGDIKNAPTSLQGLNLHLTRGNTLNFAIYCVASQNYITSECARHCYISASVIAIASSRFFSSDLLFMCLDSCCFHAEFLSFVWVCLYSVVLCATCFGLYFCLQLTGISKTLFPFDTHSLCV